MGVADPDASVVLSMIPMTMTPTVAGVECSPPTPDSLCE